MTAKLPNVVYLRIANDFGLIETTTAGDARGVAYARLDRVQRLENKLRSTEERLRGFRAQLVKLRRDIIREERAIDAVLYPREPAETVKENAP